MAGIYGIPRVPSGVVSRDRITAALSTDAPLVVVRAPAGSGKTVAVADWANQLPPVETRGVWFTMGQDTASRLDLWRGILQVMHDAALLPERGVLAASFLALEASPDLRRLLIRGFAQLRHDVVLVIDNLHLAASPEIMGDLVALLEATPGLRVIGVTRLRSELEFDAVAISLNTVVVETAQLMFTKQETVQFLQAQGLSDPGGRLSTALHIAVGGLPLTIRGVLILVQREGFDLDSDSVEERLKAAGADVLRDVWALQVGEDGDIDFAIRCSIPHSLNTELATRLTGRSDAASVLNLAEGMGVGLWTDGVGGPMFTFTPVIRDELRRELGRRFPAEVKELTRVTARWHLERAEYYLALQHAIEIDDYPLVDEAVLLGYRGFIGQNSNSIRDILGDVPLHRLRKSPLATMLLALSLNSSSRHRVRALELFALVVVSTRLRGDKVDPAKRTVLLTIESVALRVTGQAAASLSAAERVVASYDALTLAQKDQLKYLAPTLLVQAGMSFFYSGKRQRALELFQTAYALPADSGSARAHSLSLTAGVHAISGDLPEALTLIEVAHDEIWPDGQAEGYLGALYQIAEGWLALESGDFTKALNHVSVMEPHLQTLEHWPLFMQLRCMAMLESGQAGAALIALGSVLQRGARPEISAPVRAGLDATRALLLIATGQLRSAESVLKKQPKTMPEIALQWARLYLILGTPEMARAALRPLTDKQLSTRLRTELLLLRAATALRLGETELALDALDRAVELLIDRKLRLPLMLLSEADREALTRTATEHGRAHELLNDFEGIALLPATVLTPVILTEREHVVLHALVTMAGASEIAASLFVSTNTVKSQIRSLYRKLGASSREEALRRAGEQRLLQG